MSENSKEEFRIIMIGFGNVGHNLIRIMYEQEDDLKRKYRFIPKIIAICELDGALIDENGLDLGQLLEVKDYKSLPSWHSGLKSIDVINTYDSDFLVECAWTNHETGEPALSHVISAIKRGMHVVSSNKGPFYLKYSEIKELARQYGVYLGIESTVGSAIPCISAKESMGGTGIVSIRAILNGTCNYILSRMTSENLSFDLALKEAQDLGYAEADPTLDIDGYDAAGKIVILANELLGWDKTIHDVEIMGIRSINSQVIALAKEEGYLLKHVAVARDGELFVKPQLVPENSPLAVNGTLNVIEVETENAGTITFIGRGAGGSEAASGILSDLIRISSKISKAS